MKLTVFIGEYNNSLNANTRIAMSLVDEFVKMGYECDCLAINFHNDFFYVEELDGKKIKVFPVNRKNGNFRYLKDKNGEGLAKFILKNPLKGLSFLANKPKDYKEIVDYINEQSGQNNCLISLIMPFKATRIIILNNRNKVSIIHQMDPWGMNKLLSPKAYIKKTFDETKVFEKADFIFTTNLLYKDYKENEYYKKFTNKMDVLNFCNIYKKKEKKCDICSFGESDYNVVFLGILNDTYRDPSAILNYMIRAIQIYNLNIKIHFIGEITSNNLSEIKKYNEEIIHTYDPVDAYEANYLMNQNVFLLNINNSFSNQSPSKLIDYISTGNPIINVISNKEDISDEILSKYDNKYSFYNFKENNEEEFVEFIRSSNNKRIPFEQIKENYKEYTPEYTARKIIEKASELLK